MAPDGAIWCHPQSSAWRENYAAAERPLQGLFVHEMTHVWQAQRGGRWYLPLIRHPFCHYAYRLRPGKPFGSYGVEQQAEIIRRVFLSRLDGKQVAELEAVLPFEIPAVARA